MNLYNTLTQQLEPVTTDDGIFRMYVCGVTPYDTTHLGHAFTYVCFDTLARYLEFLGYRTITVQNVTDIDDDILKRAQQVGMAWDELARRETAKYQADMQALNVRPPDHYPLATQEIPKILEMVSDLLAKGYAYERNGSVYYDIHRDPDFGTLGHMDYAEMLATANERGNFPDDPNKRDPLDFVLWQSAKPGEPTWESPWGQGRPGWHIECSAMSMRYLGPKIDIHSGGADLIFPHHTCEIAQSEHYSGVRPFVHYWFHVAMVRLGGEKMSKSLGNMLFVSDLLKTYSADALRLYLLSHKYRDEWDAENSDADLRAAEQMVARWRAALSATGGNSEELNALPYQANFGDAMNDDFDTPRAIDRLDELATAINDTAALGGDVSAAQVTLRALANVLGLQIDGTNGSRAG
ncbi:MAG: cysteine--tRNA ligase [Anaerolineae bacterium]|nr:cysteine--tRNA ligase [Anaerolineae bacterium]